MNISQKKASQEHIKELLKDPKNKSVMKRLANK